MVAKAEARKAVEEAFEGTAVKVVEGARYLGGALGSKDSVREFWEAKVEGWARKLKRLSSFARTQPHAALWGFRRLKSEWCFAMGLERSLHQVPLLQPIEDLIKTEFIPALFGRDTPDDLRELLALPCRLAGLGLENPVETAASVYADTAERCGGLKGRLLTGSSMLVDSTGLKLSLKQAKRKRQAERMEELKRSAPFRMARSITLACEKGASTVFSTRPLAKYGFALWILGTCCTSDIVYVSRTCRLIVFVASRSHWITRTRVMWVVSSTYATMSLLRLSRP